MAKGLSRFAKIIVRGSWSVVKPAIDTIEITQKVVDKLETVTEKSVNILTDDNSNDAQQFKELFEEQKHEIVDLGFDIAQDEIEMIKNESTKVVALACLKALREIIANPNASYNEEDITDFLKVAHDDEVAKKL